MCPWLRIKILNINPTLISLIIKICDTDGEGLERVRKEISVNLLTSYYSLRLQLLLAVKGKACSVYGSGFPEWSHRNTY